MIDPPIMHRTESTTVYHRSDCTADAARPKPRQNRIEHMIVLP